MNHQPLSLKLFQLSFFHLTTSTSTSPPCQFSHPLFRLRQQQPLAFSAPEKTFSPSSRISESNSTNITIDANVLLKYVYHNGIQNIHNILFSSSSFFFTHTHTHTHIRNQRIKTSRPITRLIFLRNP